VKLRLSQGTKGKKKLEKKRTTGGDVQEETQKSRNNKKGEERKTRIEHAQLERRWCAKERKEKVTDKKTPGYQKKKRKRSPRGEKAGNGPLDLARRGEGKSESGEVKLISGKVKRDQVRGGPALIEDKSEELGPEKKRKRLQERVVIFYRKKRRRNPRQAKALSGLSGLNEREQNRSQEEELRNKKNGASRDLRKG